MLLSLSAITAIGPRHTSLPVQLAAHGSDRSSISTELIEPAETLQLAGLQERFAKVADAVAPSVVAISAALGRVTADWGDAAGEPLAEKLAAALERTSRVVGTGFVLDADGHILTNEHVVAESKELWVTTDDRRVFAARVLGSDRRLDLAVLRIATRDLKPVRFGTSAVRRGQWAIALGNPYGLATAGEMSMSVGVISAVDRALPRLAQKENRRYTHLIQTTAQINPGNSGGPLIDLEGQVIGINTAVILPQKQTNGIGFAQPITAELLERIERLKQGSRVAK